MVVVLVVVVVMLVVAVVVVVAVLVGLGTLKVSCGLTSWSKTPRARTGSEV